MRFKTEQDDPENAGLGKARDRLEAVKQKHPYLSYADIWTLAGYVAIEESGGPAITFSMGRIDFTKAEAEAKHHGAKTAKGSGCPFGDGKVNTSGSRLPPADLGPDASVGDDAPMCEKEAPTINAVRQTFQRMGFDDQETVALIILGAVLSSGVCSLFLSFLLSLSLSLFSLITI